MRQNPRDEKAAEWNSRGRVSASRDRNRNSRESSQLALALVLPFSRAHPEPKPRPEGDPDEERVAELKALVENGHYRVETVRLAEKMIREALLENLATDGKKGSSGAEG